MRTTLTMNPCYSVHLDCTKGYPEKQKSFSNYSSTVYCTSTSILKKHDLFLTTGPAFVPSLQRPNNISRDVEQCTSSKSRHFVSKSFDFIVAMLECGEFLKLLKFVMETIQEILKEECRRVRSCSYINSEYSVLVDSCALLGIINEPTHASLLSLHNKCHSTDSSSINIKSWKSGILDSSDAAQFLVVFYDFLNENQNSHGDMRYEPFLSSLHRYLSMK